MELVNSQVNACVNIIIRSMDWIFGASVFQGSFRGRRNRGEEQPIMRFIFFSKHFDTGHTPLFFPKIQKILPNFEMSYSDNDPRQVIADSWPRSINDEAAKRDWGWAPKFNLSSLVADMIDHLKTK